MFRERIFLCPTTAVSVDPSGAEDPRRSRDATTIRIGTATTPVPAATTTVGRLRAATADKVTRMPVMPAPVAGVTMTPTGDGPVAAARAGRRIAATIAAAEAIVAATSGVIAAATSGVIAAPVVRVTTGRTEGATGRTAVTTIGVVATATVPGGTGPSRIAVNVVVTIDVVVTAAVRVPTVGTVGHRAGAAVRAVSAPHVAVKERPRSAGILDRTSRTCPTISKRRSWIPRSAAIF